MSFVCVIICHYLEKTLQANASFCQVIIAGHGWKEITTHQLPQMTGALRKNYLRQSNWCTCPAQCILDPWEESLVFQAFRMSFPWEKIIEHSMHAPLSVLARDIQVKDMQTRIILRPTTSRSTFCNPNPKQARTRQHVGLKQITDPQKLKKTQVDWHESLSTNCTVQVLSLKFWTNFGSSCKGLSQNAWSCSSSSSKASSCRLQVVFVSYCLVTREFSPPAMMMIFFFIVFIYIYIYLVSGRGLPGLLEAAWAQHQTLIWRSNLPRSSSSFRRSCLGNHIVLAEVPTNQILSAWQLNMEDLLGLIVLILL